MRYINSQQYKTLYLNTYVSVSEKPCENNSTCVSSSSREFRCICATGYYGGACESYDACSARIRCQNSGRCVNIDNDVRIDDTALLRHHLYKRYRIPLSFI